MMEQIIADFTLVVQAGVPYIITWRVGIYIVNTLINWVTGYDALI